MIGSVDHEIGGKRKELRFSTRAMARVERNLNISIAGLMAGFGTTYGINAAAEIIAASLNAGRGADIGVAYDAIDDMGQEAAFDLVGELLKAAYPDADESVAEGDEPKKPKS